MLSTGLRPCNLEILSKAQDNRAVVPDSLTNRRRRWAHLLRSQKYEPIISDVLDEELPKYQYSTVVDVTDRISLMRECALILSSAPSVFSAAVDGDLVRRLLTDTILQEEYAAVQERAHHQPSIYIHLLADDRGTPPTPSQYLLMRDMVREYLSQGPSSADAYHIDNITPPTVTQYESSLGYRKYLHTTIRSPTRVATLHRFCAGIHSRCASVAPPLLDTPFLHPPGECGYSKNSHVRLAQHRSHKSSNYILNLVEDIFTHLYRTDVLSQHFIMHQFIIYLLFRPSQAAIAEIFCSGLLQVWVDEGGGFNAYPAGRSVATAARLGVHEWEQYERWAREKSLLMEKMRIQREKADEWRQALKWEESGDEDEDEELEKP